MMLNYRLMFIYQNLFIFHEFFLLNCIFSCEIRDDFDSGKEGNWSVRLMNVSYAN